MLKHIEIATEATKETAEQEYQRYLAKQKNTDTRDNVATFLAVAGAIAWVGCSQTNFISNLIPEGWHVAITLVILGIASIICHLTQATSVEEPSPAPYAYYQALEKGAIIKVEAWEMQRTPLVFDMRLIQEDENKEVFSTIIPHFYMSARTDIVNPVFNLDKRVLYVPYEEKEIFVNAY